MEAGARPVMRPKVLPPESVKVSSVAVRPVWSAESSTFSVVKLGGLVIVRGPKMSWTPETRLPTLTVVGPLPTSEVETPVASTLTLMPPRRF